MGNYLVISSVRDFINCDIQISTFKIGIIDFNFKLNFLVSGIEFTELDEIISIYPNPTNGQFKVNFSDTWQGDVDCNIIDIFGRSIYSRILDNNNSTSSHSIDISDSNDGIFIVQLVQGDKKTMQKIVKE